jgi:hypothetical protein
MNCGGWKAMLPSASAYIVLLVELAFSSRAAMNEARSRAFIPGAGASFCRGVSML